MPQQYIIRPLQGAGVPPVPSSVVLDKQDYRAQGGQASIYVKGDFAYKIYHDSNNCIPPKKIEELSALSEDPNIISPLGTIWLNSSLVGLLMRRVDHTLPIARLMGETFRKNNHIDRNILDSIVRALRDRLAFIHSKKCLAVDINAGNFLVDEKTFDHPVCIDTDSYATPHFPPSAIVLSICDYRARKFDEGTDWFSFGILACQLFFGLHPFRGNHPKFGPKDLKERIIARASIFDKGVKLPSNDFSVIPDDYLTWFKEIFQKGVNLPAPLNDSPIVVLLKAPRALIPRTWEIVLPSGKKSKITINDGILTIDGVSTIIKADKLFVVDNNLYVLRGENFTNVKINEFGSRIIVSPGTTWRVLPNATTMLEKVLFQDILGSPHITIPLRPGACYTVHIPEFSGTKIVDGIYENKIVELIGSKNGQYHRYRFQFKNDEKYTVTIENDIVY